MLWTLSHRFIETRNNRRSHQQQQQQHELSTCSTLDWCAWGLFVGNQMNDSLSRDSRASCCRRCVFFSRLVRRQRRRQRWQASSAQRALRCQIPTHPNTAAVGAAAIINIIIIIFKAIVRVGGLCEHIYVYICLWVVAAPKPLSLPQHDRLMNEWRVCVRADLLGNIGPVFVIIKERCIFHRCLHRRNSAHAAHIEHPLVWLAFHVHIEQLDWILAAAAAAALK